jgi:hypothetical protein
MKIYVFFKLNFCDFILEKGIFAKKYFLIINFYLFTIQLFYYGKFKNFETRNN